MPLEAGAGSLPPRSGSSVTLVGQAIAFQIALDQIGLRRAADLAPGDDVQEH